MEVGGEVQANQGGTSDVVACSGRDQHVELLETITARAKEQKPQVKEKEALPHAFCSTVPGFPCRLNFLVACKLVGLYPAIRGYRHHDVRAFPITPNSGAPS
jgi:hypothetical protein